MQKINQFLYAIHRFIKNLLTKSSPFDGRWLVGLSLISYFSIPFVGNFSIMPYERLWRRWGVPAIKILFLDTRIVLSGFECTRQGYDVLLENPCHPRLGNGGSGGIIYPRIWWKLSFLGLDQNHTIILGILFTIIFYLITLYLIGKLNIFEGLIYALVLCSPTIMFMINRGNPDMIMYIMHFISLMMAQSRKLWLRIFGYISLLFPVFLKILSFFSFTIILKEKKNTFILWFTSLIIASFIYIYSIKDEIAVSKKGLPLRGNYSFNYRILFVKLRSVLNPENIFSNKFSLIWSFLLIVSLIALIIIALKVFFGIINYLQKYSVSDASTFTKEDDFYESLFLDSFRMGSCFFLGTFVATVSWDYKLVFLIFTVPQIIAWIKQNHELSLPSSFALLGLILTLYLSSFQYKWLIDEVINWSLWLYFFYAFVLTLPKWIKVPLHNSVSYKLPQ